MNSYVDLRGLYKHKTDVEAVLNGIAYDAANDKLYITGKRWPNLYEIELIDPD